jgi:hypothetical protein
MIREKTAQSENVLCRREAILAQAALSLTAQLKLVSPPQKRQLFSAAKRTLLKNEIERSEGAAS